MTWLDHYMRESAITAPALSEAVGTTRQTISRLRTGKMKLSPEWAAKLSKPLGVKAENLLFGPQADGKIPVLQVPVRGEAAAGRWVENDDLDQIGFPPVSAVLGEHASEDQFAYRIVGPSMDQRRVFDGDFAICVPYWEARTRPRTGDIVIVEQRRGQLIERTCKELLVTKTGYELWPRSSNPKFQTPIVIPKSEKDAHASDGIEIEIIGLVIGLHVRLGS